MDKKIIVAASAIIILSILVGYMIISSRGTKLVVSPETNTAAVGQSFAVNIQVSGVTDLYGWEIRLRWNSTILDAVNVTEGSFVKSQGDTYFTSKVNNTIGSMVVDGALVGDVKGIDGSGILVAIQFRVKANGKCDLDLYETSLIDSLEQKITHTVVNGKFDSSS